MGNKCLGAAALKFQLPTEPCDVMVAIAGQQPINK